MREAPVRESMRKTEDDVEDEVEERDWWRREMTWRGTERGR